MLRDAYKDREYFERYIENEDIRIKRFSNVLEIFLGKDSKRELECKKHISSFIKNKISAMYSAGYSKSEIGVQVCEYLKYVSQIGELSYADYIDVLSYIVLFDINSEGSELLVQEKMCDNDALIRAIKGYITNKELKIDNTDLMFPDLFGIYVQYVLEKCPDIEFAEFMNNKWYLLNKDSYWYDTHLSSNDTYNGYWNWLGAALVKMCKGDVEVYKKCSYLPIDLLD